MKGRPPPGPGLQPPDLASNLSAFHEALLAADPTPLAMLEGGWPPRLRGTIHIARPPLCG